MCSSDLGKFLFGVDVLDRASGDFSPIDGIEACAGQSLAIGGRSAVKRGLDVDQTDRRQEPFQGDRIDLGARGQSPTHPKG